MRITDADALSEHKFPTPLTESYQQGWNDAIDAIVDNALTVDFEKLGESLRCQMRAEYGSCDDCELSCPRNEIIKLLNLEKSHGEWIDYSEDEGYVECPFCHELTNCEGNIEELHYCWNCGAEMRVKDELKEEEV